jgi:hypothetical protein
MAAVERAEGDLETAVRRLQQTLDVLEETPGPVTGRLHEARDWICAGTRSDAAKHTVTRRHNRIVATMTATHC